jgi:hypothetical protein
MVRLDRGGHIISAVNGMGTGDDPPNIGGPYEPRISPDGTRFAYYFYVQTSFDDIENHIRWIDTGRTCARGRYRLRAAGASVTARFTVKR